MRRSLAVLAALALVYASRSGVAQDDHLDTLNGPITAITSPITFDVSGQHVSLTRNAQFGIKANRKSDPANEQRNQHASAEGIFVGERVELSGRGHTGKHSFVADRITIVPPVVNVTGAAVIDVIPTAQPTNSAERLIRADGYLLRITPQTKLTFAPPLSSLADVSTNQWIHYSGDRKDDGAVSLTSAAIAPNTVSHGEEKLREQTEYDPSQVPYVKEASGLSKEYVLTYYKHLGPWPDASMQARVQRIGDSLIPAFERALPYSDPSKINFRFSVIDEQELHDALNFPSGVILVPRQMVERLQNDDQIAAILADSIAQILEKHSLHPNAGHDAVAAADIIGTAGFGIVPGIAADVVGNAVKDHIAFGLAQSGRVSLCLMHDAGYDIQQAPLAWWLLADKKGKPLDKVSLPTRAENLYDTLGVAWRNPAMNAASPAIAFSLTTATAQK